MADGIRTVGLEDDEHSTLAEIVRRIGVHRTYNLTRAGYYEAHQQVRDLGIAIPPQLRGLTACVGWPGMVVDAVAERLNLEGFTGTGFDPADFGVDEVWRDNELAVESDEGHLESLIHGVGFVATSRGDVDAGEPGSLITVESPLDMSGIYDPRRRVLSAAGSVVLDGEKRITSATLYLPDVTVRLARNAAGALEAVHRDEHGIGRVLVRRMVNRGRRGRQWGRSEITRPILYYTQAAVRTLRGAEVHREFFLSPQRWIIGAAESAFQDAQGNAKDAWKTYLGNYLALQYDEQVEPNEQKTMQVGQFASSAPTPYFEQVKHYAQLVAGEATLPPTYLGFVTDNPASADQIKATEARLVIRTKRRQAAFGMAWRGAMLDAVLLRDGSVPEELARGLEPRWMEAETPTLAATTDAVMKQVQAGVLPAESSVALEALGYDAPTIERIELDRRRSTTAALIAGVTGRAAEARQDPTVAAAAAARGEV